MSNNKDTIVNVTEAAEWSLFSTLCELIGVEEIHMSICLILIAMLCANVVLTTIAWTLYGRDISDMYAQLRKPGSTDAVEEEIFSEDGEERESTHLKTD